MSRLRHLPLITGLLVGLAACGGGAPAPSASRPPAVRIVTSFYPMLIMARNIVRDLPGVEVSNLTGPLTGCLHDYQLTPEAMRALADADLLIVNGSGMESFLDQVTAQYPRLRLIDASRNIPPSGVNAHLWVSVAGAIQQVGTITEQLAAVDPDRADAYRANAAQYVAKLETLRAEMHAALDPLPQRRIVTCHEAFSGFADEFGLEVVAVIEREPGSEPAAPDLAEIIRYLREQRVTALFVEPQYPARAAATIARETGAQVFTLDPAVTGPDDPDSYLRIMRANLAVLREALAAS